MAIIPSDILWTDGQDNDAGLASELYYAPLADVATFPAVIAVPTNFDEKVTVSSDFVMQSGKQFFQIYGTLEKGSVISTLVGERDGKSFENMAKFVHPGNKPYLLGFLEYLKNTNLVFIVKELDGQMRIIGSEDLPAKIDAAESTTGEAVADLKHIEITVKSIGRIAPVYTGTVPLTPAP